MRMLARAVFTAAMLSLFAIPLAAQSVSFETSGIAVQEGVGNATVRVNRTGSTTGSTTVSFNSFDVGSATVNSDYQLPGGFTFAPGETFRDVNIPILQDANFEGNENFSIFLSVTSGGSSGFPSTLQVTIIDDDPTVTVGFTQSAYSTVETAGGSVTLTVGRNGTTGTSTVQYATSSSSAQAGSDYTASSGTLTFAPGESSKTITVAIVNDDTFEATETFVVTLGNASNAVVTDPSATVTILDNDEPTNISLSAAEYTSGEGAGTVTITVNRSGNLSGSSTVQYRTDNNFSSGAQQASSSTDYLPVNGTLTFAPGEATRTVNVAILDDFSAEPREVFGFYLSNVTGGVLQTPSAASVFITDNEQQTFVGFTDSTTQSVSENGGSIQIAVSRSGDTSGTTTVSYVAEPACCPQATAGSDYVAAAGTLTFAPGETSKNIAVTILDDAIFEGTEFFQVRLTAGGNVQINDATAAVSILDDEQPTRVTVPATASVNESAGSITVTVVRSGTLTGTTTVEYATGPNSFCCDDATAGIDYTSASGTLTFAPGETSKPVAITILGDQNDEPDERFRLRLLAVTGGGINNSQTVITIADDDLAPTYSLASATPQVGEGAGTLTLTVQRSGFTAGSSSVTYAAEGQTATDGIDFSDVSGTLNFAAGQTNATFTVSIVEDSIFEGTETFSIRLGGSTAGTVSIIDNETAPVLTVADVAVTEGDIGTTTVLVNVTISGSLARTVSYRMSTEDGTARAPGDYDAAPSITITFAPGERQKSVAIRVRGDMLDEGDETFSVRATPSAPCSCPPSDPDCCGLPRPGKPIATVTIRNDDFSFSVADVPGVIEGNSGDRVVTFVVRLSGKLPTPASISYTTVNGTASAGSDYAAASGTLEFAPGETRKDVEVTVHGDTTAEEAETFSLRLSNAVGAPVTRSSASATIGNDDEFFATTAGLEFATAGSQPLLLDLYVPTAGNGPFPLIIWIHGDNWAEGSRAVTPAIRLTQRGYAVAAIDYRLSDVAKFPAQLLDAKAAVRFLRANADRFRLDPMRFAAWGQGSGGHIAALLGTTGDVAAFDDPALGGNPAISSRVQAVVTWAAPIDLLQLQRDALPCGTTNHDSSGSWVSLMLGCSVQLCPDQAAIANPTTYITADDPPFLIVHGDADCEVSPAQSIAFHRALRNARVDATLRLFPGVGHSGAFWDSTVALTEVDGFLDAKLRGGVRRRVTGR